jgi:hypothetical protein
MSDQRPIEIARSSQTSTLRVSAEVVPAGGGSPQTHGAKRDPSLRSMIWINAYQRSSPLYDHNYCEEQTEWTRQDPPHS